MLAIERTILHKLKLVRIVTAVLFCCIVLPLALGALESDLFNRTFLFVCHIYNSLGQKPFSFSIHAFAIYK